MRTILILLFSLCSTTIAAQESQYEQMKQSLDEHSLPLVNMIVDIGKVNKHTFVTGEIEIADFHRRTDPTSPMVRFNCKYRIRGGFTTKMAKKSFYTLDGRRVETRPLSKGIYVIDGWKVHISP